MSKFNQWLVELENRKSPEGVQMVKEEIMDYVDSNLPEQKQELKKKVDEAANQAISR